MLYLKCTNDVLKSLGLKAANVATPTRTDAALGNWYIKRFMFDRRMVFVFMSDATLLSFVLIQGQRPITTESLPRMMLGGLEQLLEMRNFNAQSISKALQPYSTGLFSKTDSRSDLGSLNDLVACYGHIIDAEGGLARCNLTDIIMRVNEMPQRKLNWGTSWDITAERLISS